MTLLSSRMTFFYKRVFPAAWFGLLALFIIGALVSSFNSGESPNPMAIIMPVIMMVIGFAIMRKMAFNLVDEVFDVGDALLIKNGAQQEQIPLSEITNVGYAQMMNPPQVTLSLRRPTSFGDKVTFCAPVRLMSFSASPVIDGLIKRVDDARRRGR